MQLRFKYLTVCTLSAMLIACGGGGSEGYYEADKPSKVPENPGNGTNELPGDGSDSSTGDGSSSSGSGGSTGGGSSDNGSGDSTGGDSSGNGSGSSNEKPDTSIPSTPIGPSTPVQPDTSIPSTPVQPDTSIPSTSIGPSKPVQPETSIPSTPIGPSKPVQPDTSIPSTPIGPSTPISKYPEPKKDVTEKTLLGFYDFNAQGENRLLRNDLIGSFNAMMQFAQSHVVNPKNNEQDKMPRLTSEKEALLLVTPHPAMGDLDQLQVEIYQGSRLVRTAKLKEPSRIAVSDQSNNDSRPRVSYSKQAWSLALTWEEVKAGLSIKVVDPEHQRSGTLGEADIDFAAPGELVVQSIRLGLLTKAPQSSGHYMLLEPEKAGTDYFQTIPAARMIVSKYDEMKLDRVMVANGTIYDSVSVTDGGVYSGDMRENTAKSTFSTGINLANWGVTSSSMQSQDQPQVTQSVVIHHARGKYANGESNHGLSGGNGILTLIDSIGNEFSHEIGHHYGLGHYPGQSGSNYFWAAHHADSGWGYIAYRNKMRGNLNWGNTNLGDGSNGVPNFQNLYAYGWDAMSGGASASSISKYTHYTGYSTWLKIQPAFDKYVWDKDSNTGYKKWNPTTRTMENAQPKVPQSGYVWYNSQDGNFLKPRLFSVPVYTILGGYDPVQQVGIVYPAARGNWGNVFNLPQANTNSTAANCWLNVQYSGRPAENIALSPNRMAGKDAGNANKFHINLAQEDQPRHVNLYCQKEGEQAIQLSNIDIPINDVLMNPFVEIGREKGYSALRAIEMPQLDNALVANMGKAVVKLDAQARLLFDSYRLFKDELSANAQSEVIRYTQQQIKLYRLNRWVNVYRSDLVSGNTEAIEAFQAFVKQLELEGDFNLNEVSSLKNGTNCLKVETLSDGKLNAYISGKSACTGDDSEQWIYDAMGKIHSKKYMDQCLASQAGVINLASCNNESSAQAWMINSTLQRIEQGSKCFDLEYGYLNNNRARLISYNCGTGGNQKWTSLLSNNSLILAATSSANLPLIKQLLIH
ncbi:M66 family metalloprotease [Acinetobacter wuhouensis]|uniref:Glycosyl transferase n=1 Tax=Acinetobacter wuhouensis TaxID=1879050 RepID=A0A3G2T367_9GAMM|nr:M66 family metalloprotease [Acinetobacter wuhouensis]AYO54531.1 glycosyl transferase [Acinetobacter wuhouensis]